MTGLSSLSSLRAAGFPRLGYLDAAGLLRSLPFLTTLRIELKDPTVGGDTLAPALQPRLQELGLHGSRVRSLSSSALAGLKVRRRTSAPRCSTSARARPRGESDRVVSLPRRPASACC